MIEKQHTQKGKTLMAYLLIVFKLFSSASGGSRKKNLEDLNAWLADNILLPVRLDPELLLYVALQSYRARTLFLLTEVSISFELTKEMPFKKELEALQKPLPETRYFEVTLQPGEKTTGRQVFLYTFSDLKKIDQNRKEFTEFVHESYATQEEMDKEDVYYWNILKNASPEDRNN